MDELQEYKKKRHLALRTRTLIEWVNGEPRPYTEFVVPKNQIENVFTAALSLPYEGTPDPAEPTELYIEPEFKGMTNLEVGAIKTARKFAQGDLDTVRLLTDRLLGKPKQAIENMNVEVSLKDYLDSLDLEKKAKEWDLKTVDIKAELAQETPITEPDWYKDI